MTVTSEQLGRIVDLAKQHGATRLILFGSAAQTPHEARDIDLGCDGIEGWGLFRFAGEVENRLGVLLDVVPLSPPTPFTQQVEREGRVLL